MNPIWQKWTIFEIIFLLVVIYWSFTYIEIQSNDIDRLYSHASLIG